MNDGTLSKGELFKKQTGVSDSLMTPRNVQEKTNLVNKDDLTNLLDFAQFVLEEQKDKIEEMSEKEVIVANTRVRIKDASELRFELDGKLVQIQMDYVSGFVGYSVYILKSDDALRLAELLSKQTNLTFSEFTLNVLTNGFSEVLGTSNKQISSITNRNIMMSTPKIDILDNASQIKFPDESQMLVIHCTLSYDDVSIGLYQLISTPLAKEFLSVVPTILQEDRTKTFVGDGSSETFRISEAIPSAVIRPIRYQEIDKAKLDTAISNSNIALLLDISMQMTVELGRSKMQIKDILALGEGSIIELDKLAGEPVDLLVNDKLVAKGEVVVIDENFGVRITEIVMPGERLESLLSD